MYTELSTMADKAAAAAAAPAPQGQSSDSWTQDRITAEVQSALREVLGRSLEPDEPFMSGQWTVVTGGWIKRQLIVHPICRAFLFDALQRCMAANKTAWQMRTFTCHFNPLAIVVLGSYTCVLEIRSASRAAQPSFIKQSH